jgi:hypothetical protein
VFTEGTLLFLYISDIPKRQLNQAPCLHSVVVKVTVQYMKPAFQTVHIGTRTRSSQRMCNGRHEPCYIRVLAANALNSEGNMQKRVTFSFPPPIITASKNEKSETRHDSPML